MAHEKDEEKIVERINKSGFPLQIALEDQVKTGRTGWRVGAREHHWHNLRTGQEGWIDLVLEKQNAVAVVECKRAIGGKWAFLIESARKTSQARCRVVQNKFIDYPSSGNWRTTTIVHELLLEPYTYESEYCINVGENQGNARELLEHTASTLLLATEALARNFEPFVTRAGPIRNYFSVIATTAEIYAAFVDPSTISLTDGVMPQASTERIPYIRFAKQLWSGEDHPTMRHDHTMLTDQAKAKVHTVIVVHTPHFLEFLRCFAADNE